MNMALESEENVEYFSLWNTEMGTDSPFLLFIEDSQMQFWFHSVSVIKHSDQRQPGEEKEFFWFIL